MKDKNNNKENDFFAPSKIWRIVSYNKNKQNKNGKELSFKEFISFENSIFDKMVKEKGLNSRDLCFVEWLNKKYKKDINTYITSKSNSKGNEKGKEQDYNFDDMNADGGLLDKIGNVADKVKDTVDKVGNVISTEDDETVGSAGVATGTGGTPYKPNTVLGMKPIVAYTLGLALASALAYGGFVIYRNVKK